MCIVPINSDETTIKINILWFLTAFTSQKYFFTHYRINNLIKAQYLFLPNKSIQIVSSKTLFTVPSVLIKEIVVKNIQNSGDLITSKSFISSFDVVPGIIDNKHTNTNVITELTINTDRRHLYLSVTAPTIGLINIPGIGCSMNIKPTINAE